MSCAATPTLARARGGRSGSDTGVVRAHQHAAGARHEPPADIPAEVVATLELPTRGSME